jgi:hypothetical protein
MAVSLKHAFSSGKADGVDATLVQPSNWNSEHNLTVSSPIVLGRLGFLWPTAINITAITNANPGVFTSTGAGSILTEQLVTISGVGGMTELNGKTYVYTFTGGNTFRLADLATPTVPLNTTSYGTYTSGGTATPTGAALAVELSTTGTGSPTDKVVLDASPTINTPTLINPRVTNYVETLYSANTSTAITVDLANGTVQNLTLTASATITMPTAVAGKSFIIILTQNGGFTVNWSTVSWPSATPPALTTTAARKDIFSFFSNGTSWFGTTIGQNYT